MKLDLAGLVFTFDIVDAYEAIAGRADKTDFSDYREQVVDNLLKLDKVKEVEGPFINGVIAVTYEIDLQPSETPTKAYREARDKIHHILVTTGLS